MSKTSLSDYQKTVAKGMSESQLQAAIIDCAWAAGWKVHWIPDWIFRLAMGSLKRSPRRGRKWSPPGVPDLVLVKSGRLIFAELKSETGRVRIPQREWLDELESVENIEVHVWRPRHWMDGSVQKILEAA